MYGPPSKTPLHMPPGLHTLSNAMKRVPDERPKGPANWADQLGSKDFHAVTTLEGGHS